jgi:mono/diheme cytochrome c family protein
MKGELKYIMLVVMVLIIHSCSNQNPSETQKLKINSKNNITSEPQSHDKGKILFMKYCLACHQTDGSGVPGMYPPLIQSPIINTGNKQQIINILLNGLEGPIQVNGQTYNQQMPKQAFLTNEQLSLIINYVSKSFKNQGPIIQPSEIESVRKQMP